MREVTCDDEHCYLGQVKIKWHQEKSDRKKEGVRSSTQRLNILSQSQRQVQKLKNQIKGSKLGEEKSVKENLYNQEVESVQIKKEQKRPRKLNQKAKNLRNKRRNNHGVPRQCSSL